MSVFPYSVTVSASGARQLDSIRRRLFELGIECYGVRLGASREAAVRIDTNDARGHTVLQAYATGGILAAVAALDRLSEVSR